MDQQKELSEITKSWFITEVEEWVVGGEGEKQGTTTLGFSTLLKDSPNAVREVERRRRWGISFPEWLTRQGCRACARLKKVESAI